MQNWVYLGDFRTVIINICKKETSLCIKKYNIIVKNHYVTFLCQNVGRGFIWGGCYNEFLIVKYLSCVVVVYCSLLNFTYHISHTLYSAVITDNGVKFFMSLLIL